MATCIYCAQPFMPVRRNQKFCSKACRRKAKAKYVLEYMSRKRKDKSTLECPVCHDKFSSKGNQKYCSLVCRRTMDLATAIKTSEIPLPLVLKNLNELVSSSTDNPK